MSPIVTAKRGLLGYSKTPCGLTKQLILGAAPAPPPGAGGGAGGPSAQRDHRRALGAERGGSGTAAPAYAPATFTVKPKQQKQKGARRLMADAKRANATRAPR